MIMTIGMDRDRCLITMKGVWLVTGSLIEIKEAK
jgi:hypothetical protein